LIYCAQCKEAVCVNKPKQKRKPRFCSEQCKKESYRHVARQLQHKKWALAGKPMRPCARIDPIDDWGDRAIRLRVQRNGPM